MRRTVLARFVQVLLLMAIAIGVLAQGSKKKASAPLEKTQWKLTWLGGTKIETATPQQMPYIQLDPESHRVSGSGGCNRLSGGYELSGGNLRFTQMAMTRMACLHGSETEAGFTQALDEVKSWKIFGSKLLLMNADGRVVAKFWAIPPET